uniref:gluconokinase n=1 Tax=Kalanchoe fedtschenkoi TaxID=63787 RepID=A0A7N0VNN2_KALFE
MAVEPVVLMGVSGAGKSLGKSLQEAMDCMFLDADDFHSQNSKQKMRQGVPLTEEDRFPWLETLQGTLRKNIAMGQQVVLSCSALRKGYREVLRSADESYKQGSFRSRVRFVLLDAKAEVLEARLLRRLAEGKHFMQVDQAEGILTVDATLKPEAVVNVIQVSHTLGKQMVTA